MTSLQPNRTKIETLQAVAPALHTYRRAVHGSPRVGDTADQRRYVWVPAFRIAAARAVTAFCVSFAGVAVGGLYDARLLTFSQSQWITILLFLAAGVGSLSFVSVARAGMAKWLDALQDDPIDLDSLQWLLGEVSEPAEPEPAEPAPVVSTDITLADYKITWNEADHAVKRATAERGASHSFNRSMFSKVNDRRYAGFVQALKSRGYAIEPRPRNYEWTPDGIEWLQGVMHGTPRRPAPDRPASGSGRAGAPGVQSDTTATTDTTARPAEILETVIGEYMAPDLGTI